jgi:hypothetical protein
MMVSNALLFALMATLSVVACTSINEAWKTEDGTRFDFSNNKSSKIEN